MDELDPSVSSRQGASCTLSSDGMQLLLELWYVSLGSVHTVHLKIKMYVCFFKNSMSGMYFPGFCYTAAWRCFKGSWRALSGGSE